MENRHRVEPESIFFREVSFVALAVLVLSATTVSIGCRKKIQPPICTEFYSKSSSLREKEFRSLSLQDQLKIHRCGLEHEPPVTIYANEISNHGKAVIPALFEFAETNSKDQSYVESDYDKYAVLIVFQALSEGGELDRDSQTLNRVREMVKSIKTNWIRGDSNYHLSKIEENVKMDSQ